MIRTPAHKQTDPDKKPGQIVNNNHSVRTLGDYIQQVEQQEQPKKFTFEEWLKTQPQSYYFHPGDWLLVVSWMEKSWKAAQENK